jgi:hypothetical protein
MDAGESNATTNNHESNSHVISEEELAKARLHFFQFYPVQNMNVVIV